MTCCNRYSVSCREIIRTLSDFCSYLSCCWLGQRCWVRQTNSEMLLLLLRHVYILYVQANYKNIFHSAQQTVCLFDIFYRAMLRTARWCHSVSSVRPSVCDIQVPWSRIAWNSSKIISRPNSSRLMRGLTPTWAIWSTGKPQKLGWNRGWVRSPKILQYLRNGAR